MLVHENPIMTKIITITDQIQITDPDDGSGITVPRLRIWMTNLDHGFGLRITDPDNGKRIGINLVIIG